MPQIRLIIGLGNPGKEYVRTRHNVGTWLVQRLAEKAQVDLLFESKFHGLYRTCQLGEHHFALLVPTTYMNHSGQSVNAAMNFYKIKPQEILVVHDDIDLPTGSIRLKFDGGDGGHNGLKDIISHLNTKAFYRLRIGVGRPPRHHEVVDYVLNQPSVADRLKIEMAFQEVIDILHLILTGELEQAMQILHTVKE